jgi:CheY-like chemotaxis protein
VEDEDSLRCAVAKMLRNSGLSVLEAADGTTAIAAIRGDTARDVLLLDVTIPGASSREVLAEAKRLRPAMRVIVASAYGEEFAATSLQANVERFIRKLYSLRRSCGTGSSDSLVSAPTSARFCAWVKESLPAGLVSRYVYALKPSN